MKRYMDGYDGISRIGYGIEIKGGKHMSTPQGEFAELKHGQEYSIKVVNMNSHRCRLKLEIDGQHQGTWQLDDQCTADLERPAEIAKKFTFYRVKHAPKSSGIKKGNQENGLVSCTFTPEQNARHITFRVSQTNSASVGAQFKMFGKHTTYDLANQIKQVIQDKFGATDLCGQKIIQWQSDSYKSYLSHFVNLTGDENEFLCISGYHDGNVYSFSIVPDIKVVKLSFKGETVEHNVLSKCTLSNIIKNATEKWGLSNFYLLSEGGRALVHSSWPIEMYYLYEVLHRDDILSCSMGVLSLSVVEELPTGSSCFPVSIITLTGKTVKIMIHGDSTVYEMKLRIQVLEGVPPEQMRLVCRGKQLEEGRTASNYPALMEDKVMHLMLRWRGGGMDQSLVMKASGADAEGEAATSGKKLNAPDSSWVAGATTLGNKSDQSFRSVPALAVDHSQAVTLGIRLVARGDELTDYSQYEDVECTPLASAVPPPVPE